MGREYCCRESEIMFQSGYRDYLKYFFLAKGAFDYVERCFKLLRQPLTLKLIVIDNQTGSDYSHSIVAGGLELIS